MSELARIKREGTKLADGVYDDGEGSLHVDLVELLEAAGIDPSDEEAVGAALDGALKAAEEAQVPVEILEKDD